MDENQSTQQDGQAPETAQTSEPNVFEPQPRIQPPATEPPAPKKSRVPLLIVVLLVLFAVGGAAAYFMMQDDEPTPVESSQTVEEPKDTDSTQQTPVEDEQLTVDNDYFTLLVPEGFSAVDERIFTYTGTPTSTYSFKNTETNDYFEVNIEPAQSGINADFVWTYVYADGVFTLDKSDSTVCTADEDEWCETSGGNGRLDSAIFSNPNQVINGNEYYFTFGNTNSEAVGSLSYVDQFLEGLEIK